MPGPLGVGLNPIAPFLLDGPLLFKVSFTAREDLGSFDNGAPLCATA